MGKKSAPPAPDYTGAAVAQGESSQANTLAQTYANRPELSTPWGTQSWTTSAGVDPATGRPITNWSSSIELSPQQQAALDSQMAVQTGRSQGAETLLNQAVQNFQNPMDWSGLPQGAQNVQAGQLSDGTVPGAGGAEGTTWFPTLDSTRVQGGQLQRTLNGGAGDYRSRAQSAVEELQRPELERARAALDTQLANQGITRGSEAYESAMRQQGDMETRAQLQAIAAGRDEASAMFGQDLQAGQFQNQAQQQDFQQLWQNALRGDQQAMQQLQMNIAGGSFNNAAQQQNFQQLMAQAQRGDQNALNQLQMQMNAGNFNNANRQQAIGETTLQRNQTLNELNALLTGQQVQSPNMPSFTNAGRADSTNYLGAAQATGQSQMDAYNAQQAGTAGMMNGLFSLGGAAMGSPTGWAGLFNFGG